MPTLPSLITAILVLEKAAADKERGTVDSLPGPPATEAKIAAAEKSRGRKFHRSYREFLKLHDGWKDFRWGMQLRPVAELTGSAYDPGYIEDMIADEDDRITDEVKNALVIGWSENDAALFLLTDKGEVLDWKYEVEHRYKDITALIAAHLKTLREIAAADAATEKAIEASWQPAVRAKGEATLAKQLRKVLANAPAVDRVKPPAAPKKRPAATKPTALVATRKKKIAAEVMQHLWLYLGAYPSADEVMAAYRAWSAAYPVEGKMSWMGAGDFFPDESEADEATLRDALRIRRGSFGLRVSRDVKRAGGPLRYVLNVVGVPPTEDETTIPRASFCEVIVPTTESPETLVALAEELLGILPVRSGHGGYAAYVWDEDSDVDPLPDIFAWCRRFFAIDIGTIDGWLPGVLTRLHGASWLTVLGPAFATELEHAKRLRFSKDVTLIATERGTIIRAGELSLGDAQRGEFPTAIAEVQAAIAPVLVAGYDKRGWASFAGTFFDTQSEDLLPMRSHQATGMYLDRFRDPAAWLGPTPREQGEAWLAKIGKGGKYVKEWAAEQKTYIPSFSSLLLCIANAATGRTDDATVAALEFVTQWSDAHPSAFNRLIYTYDLRKEHAKALALVPAALAHAEKDPSIYHNAAWIVFQAGDHARAMKLIEQAGKAGYEGMDKLRDDKDFAPLRKLAAWKRVFGTAR